MKQEYESLLRQGYKKQGLSSSYMDNSKGVSDYDKLPSKEDNTSYEPSAEQTIKLDQFVKTHQNKQSDYEMQRSFNSKELNRADFIRDISPLSHNQSMSQEQYKKFMEKGSLTNLMKPLN